MTRNTPPKYEPLKMGNKIHADNYGKAWLRYEKRKFNKELNERRNEQKTHSK